MRLDSRSFAARSLTRVLTASAETAGCECRVHAASDRPWASATYTGARHRVVLGIAASVARHRWLAALAEADLPIHGHVVLPPAILGTSDDTVELEILTLEDH